MINPVYKLELKNTLKQDLDILFDFQLDSEAIYLAAFTAKDPSNKTSYLEKWTRLLSDRTVHLKTIYMNDKIVGSIAKFEMDGRPEITYWIGKDFWGKGIASESLQQFLFLEKMRPIYGRVAHDNYGSQKVLQKCGFQKIGTEKGFANARGKEIDEFIYQLE